MGYLLGLTGGYAAYYWQLKNGFSFLPYGKHKIGQYTIIIGSFLLLKAFGQ